MIPETKNPARCYMDSESMKKRGVFDPNLAIEAFPSVPQNTILTMGSRPSKRPRTHTETNDVDIASMLAREDGFEDH